MSLLKLALGICLLSVTVTGCTPPVGSEAWCKHMKEKEAGDWTANEAKDYTRHCLFPKN